MSASFVRAHPCPPGHLRTHKLVRSPRPTYDDTHETSRAEYSASTKSHRDSDVSLKCSTSTPPVRDGFHRLDPSLNYRPLCTASQRSPIKPPRNRQQNLVQNPPPASRSRRHVACQPPRPGPTRAPTAFPPRRQMRPARRLLQCNQNSSQASRPRAHTRLETKRQGAERIMITPLTNARKHAPARAHAR